MADCSPRHLKPSYTYARVATAIAKLYSNFLTFFHEFHHGSPARSPLEHTLTGTESNRGRNGCVLMRKMSNEVVLAAADI